MNTSRSSQTAAASARVSNPAHSTPGKVGQAPVDGFQGLADLAIWLAATCTRGEICSHMVAAAAKLTGGRRLLFLLESDEGFSIAGSRLPRGETGAELLAAITRWLTGARCSRSVRLRHGPDGARGRDKRSCLVVPLRVDGALLGVLYVDVEGRFGRFADTEADLLSRLAALAAHALCSLDTRDSLLRQATDRGVELDQLQEHLTATTEVLQVILSKQMLHIPDWLDIELPSHAQKVYEQNGNRSSLMMPLLRAGACIGLPAFGHTKPHRFSEKEIALMRGFVDQAMIAIENVRLFNETREALNQQTATAEVLEVISSSVADAAPVFDKILDICQKLFESSEQGIVLIGSDGFVELAAHHGESAAALRQFYAARIRADSYARGILRGKPIHVVNTLAAEVHRDVRAVAELMGGTMLAQSDGLGRGSSFVFTIQGPLAAPPSAKRRDFIGQQPVLVGKRLLVVVEHATNRKVLSLQAGKWGMVIRDTESATKALQWLDKSEDFDLAVLDMHMPEMDGLRWRVTNIRRRSVRARMLSRWANDAALALNGSRITPCSRSMR